MTLSSAYRALDAVAQHLPFHLNETDQVNAAFVRWRGQHAAEDKRIVDIWTYCFIRRYFLAKMARDAAYRVADFDDLTERTFHKVSERQDTVRESNRYASWVSVICKHTYLNYLRARRRIHYIEDESMPALRSEPDEPLYDIGVAHQAIHEALGRLPPFLQDTARLRFLEECSYEEIAAATGKSMATARAYVNKALNRLREDEQFMSHFDGDYREEA